MVKKILSDAWSYFSPDVKLTPKQLTLPEEPLPATSPDVKLTPKQLTLPEQPLPATCKSIPLLIPNNTYYSPEENTLLLRKGQLHIH